MSKHNETQWFHEAEDLNGAILTLREECQDHLNCKECPLVTTNGKCSLTEYSPCDWEDVEDDY